MIFRVTRKLGKKIHVALEQCLPVAENPFLDWHASLFTVGGEQYILVTNTRSLYSMIIVGRGVTDEVSFLKATFGGMSDLLKHDGYESVFREVIAPQTGEILFSKTGDRRVLASMNDFLRQAKYHLGERKLSPFEQAMYHLGKPEVSPFEVSLHVNESPMSLLGMNSPRRAFMSMSAGK